MRDYTGERERDSRKKKSIVRARGWVINAILKYANSLLYNIHCLEISPPSSLLLPHLHIRARAAAAAKPPNAAKDPLLQLSRDTTQ